jgi:hypothetical protein
MFTVSGIVTLCTLPSSAPIKSGLQSVIALRDDSRYVAKRGQKNHRMIVHLKMG